jgi:hypothetical protein
VKIENRTLRVPARPRGSWLERVSGALQRHLEPDTYPLRLSIVEVRDGSALLEVTVVTGWRGPARSVVPERHELLAPRPKAFQGSPFAVVQVVPTGVRCELGGFAGDASPATNLLAAAADAVVTHPNAVNASDVNEMAENVWYVEGKSLDDFLLGHVGLRPARNRIGTFVDPAGLEFLDDLTNCLNTARAVAGIDCGVYTVLRETLGVRIEWSSTGCAVGTVVNPEVLIAAVEELLREGAQAVGGVSVIHGVTREMFRRHLKGEIPNPSGGVEAILTHLISAWFRLPTAHAPLPYYRHLKGRTTRNPRAAAEFISTPHYFCVLKGLARAPQPVVLRSLDEPPGGVLTLNNVGAIVLPASCLGGVPALAAEFSGLPLIAVKENRTILDVTNARMRMSNVIEVSSYLEAAGVVLALREGISLESLRRPLGPIRRAAMAELSVAVAGNGSRPGAKAVR